MAESGKIHKPLVAVSGASGFVGSKEDALDHIEEVWTDMRPLSERRAAALKIYQRNLAAGKGPAVDGVKYRVVINHEEQYSIWIAKRELPKGWQAAGFVGMGIRHRRGTPVCR